MKICIVGSGLAGLAAAFYLSRYPEAEITVYEQGVSFGGRANVEEGGEHCPRVFLEDYVRLFEIMRQIPADGGGSLYDRLRRLHRFARTGDGAWVEISHLYRIMAKEFSLVEKLRISWNWRPTPLIGEHTPRERGANRYGSVLNYSPRTVLRMAGNLFRSKTGFALPGSTDVFLIEPWVHHLRAHGVTLTAGRRVTGVNLDGDPVDVRTSEGWQRFDAVVVTAFVPDLVALLNSSKIDHGVREVDHMHNVAYTIDLDPREEVLSNPEPAFYGCGGVAVLVQPEAGRAVALCVRNPRTDEQYVLDRLRDHLGLRFPVGDVAVRMNQRPGEAILAGDYTRPEHILRRPSRRLYFAGSHIRNSYPMDSAEGAVLTALAAVRALLRDHPLGAASASHPARST
ncbi:FAD-dependent oxidoreductase [Nonomuraea sp. NPDC055795]